MTGGYFIVPRGVMEDPRLGPPEPFTRRQAWIWLLEQAAWKPVQVYVEGAVVDLERGQLSHSTRFLADAWGWDRSKVRRLLAHVSRMNMARVETDPGQTVITICNYEEISGRDRNIDPLPTQDRPSTDPKKKQGNTETESNAAALPRSRRPAGAGDAAEGVDLFGNARVPTDRERLYRIGPAIVSRMTGKQGHEAMKFLSAMVKAARDDCGRVLEVFREAEKREPLMIPAAFLMDRARGSRLAPVSGTPRSDRLEGYFTRPAPDERPAFDVEGTIFQETTA